MGKALEAVTARDARGFFEPCGYLASGPTILMAAEAVGTSLLPLPYHNPGYLRAVSRVFAPERHGEKPSSVC